MIHASPSNVSIASPAYGLTHLKLHDFSVRIDIIHSGAQPNSSDTSDKLGPQSIMMIFFNEFILANFGATELNIFFTGLLMIITLMYFPEGIVGSLKKRKLLPGFLDWG